MATGGSSEADDGVLDEKFWAKEPETVDLWCTALSCAWPSSDAATAFLSDLGVAFSSGSAVFLQDSRRQELLVRLAMDEAGSKEQKRSKKANKRKEAEASMQGRYRDSSDEAGGGATTPDGKVHKRASRKEKELRKHEKSAD
jgi:hypothetical protein